MTWTNTSSMPHQYPLPVTQFIISLSRSHIDNNSLLHYTYRATLFQNQNLGPPFTPFSKLYHRGLSPLSHHYQYILTPSSLDSTGFMIKLDTYTMLLSYQNPKTQKQLLPIFDFWGPLHPMHPIFFNFGPGS
jgi:hypothetical protein